MQIDKINKIDKQVKLGFVLTGIVLSFLFLLFLLISEEHKHTLLREDGIIELLTVFIYFLCIICIFYTGKLDYLKSGYGFIMLIILFMLRELDFDKTFTTMSILKPKLYFNSEAYLTEKIIGIIIILLLLYIALWIIYNYSREFLFHPSKNAVISLGALLIIIFLVVAKLLDGISRKLKMFGVEINSQIRDYAWAIEEILELGIPIIILLTFWAYFAKQKASS